VPKSDFAPWLKNNSSQDVALTELKQFAEAHRAEWPYHSNRMADYVRVVLNAHDPEEDALLTSLERYFWVGRTWEEMDGGCGVPRAPYSRPVLSLQSSSQVRCFTPILSRSKHPPGARVA